ncbi:M43 family zinc metalloprotease [Paraflavitalea pollutisoli]|uniref:M43 family zinc metalloprotease n=1 Tax=Paraflavitalea pollutisoli TaxID=3034143 RepID=UPI0023EC3A29|nr:M43 family zinc metalloprotease [Paraflavitalea sp. H1-2-19X]
MKHVVLASSILLMAGSVCAQRPCASFEYQQQQLQANPALAAKMTQALARPQSDVLLMGAGDAPAITIIKIPVVVHVLYNVPANNISDAQIKSQIDVLNRDFRRLNADTVFTPAIFKKLAADCQIEFELARIDPKGQKTTGILRKSSNIQMYGLDDRIKYTSKGGSDAWDADSYLNIWVGTLAGGLLGYTSVLGGDKAVDGVAIAPTAFGTQGTAAAPYNKGRTATHEIGHWLGLMHLWGDQVCGDDQIDDTPKQRLPTRKCPSGVQISCGTDAAGDMYSNFMDFTDDACLNLFTQGQRARMRSLFEPGGPRNSLLASKGVTGTPVVIIDQPVEEPIRELSTEIKLYPSPATTYFTLQEGREGELLGKELTITNRFGQQMMQKQLTKGNTAIYIDHLPDGIYFVKIQGVRRVYKLLKGQ